MRKRWWLALGALGMTLSGPAWADRDTARYTSLTVFGDSLVDAGNYYLATGGVNPAPGLPYPDTSAGYYPYRLTNGLDYTDLLSQDLFNGATTTPSLIPGGSNFAFAAAGLVNNGLVPDITTQLGMWGASGQAVDPNGLYVMTFGANDVFGLLGVFGPPPADPAAFLQTAVQQYVAGIQALDAAGVRNIFITDFPLAGNPYTDLANGYLNAALAGLTLHADTDLMVYSLSNVNTRIVSDPAAFGLPPLDTTTSCIAAGAQSTGCAGYLYFDGVHPTAAIQAAAYADMNSQFNLTASIPEPGTWAMMLLGFAMIGMAMRRRESVSAPMMPDSA